MGPRERDGPVGRAAQLDVITGALARARLGVGLSLAITGEPGIGKTLLLDQARARAQREGLQVLSGDATEFERQIPFGLVADALYHAVGERDATWLERLGPEPRAELASVVPALTAPAGASSSRLASERFRLYQAVRRVLEALVRDQPLLLVFDDLHWADDASVELVSHLMRSPTPGVAMIVAFRAASVAPTLTRSLAAAERNGSGAVLTVGPLTQAEARQLIGGEVADRDVRMLYRECGGNPFYLTEAVRALHAANPPRPISDRNAALSDRADLKVPPRVIDALDEEIAAISDDARRLLRAAAVAGEPFGFGVAAEVAELDGRRAQEALHELRDLGLIRPVEAPHRFTFRHPVIRAAVYESAGPGFRSAAHARAVKALERSGAHLSVLAHHVSVSATRGDADAVALLARAAELVAPRAPSTAARWYSRALELLPDAAAPEQRLGLLIPLATALGTTGRATESKAALRDVLPLVSSDAILTGRLLGAIVRLDHMVADTGEATELLEPALGKLGNTVSHLSCALKLELAMENWSPDSAGAMVDYARQARNEAAELEEAMLYATACAVLGQGRYLTGDIARAREVADEAAELIDGLPDRVLATRLEAIAALGLTEFGVERFTASARHLARGVEICRVTRQEAWIVTLQHLLGIARLWAGRLHDAATAIELAVESARLGHDQLLIAALSIQSWLRLIQGDLSGALHLSAEAVAIADAGSRGMYSWLPGCFHAAAMLEAGEHGPARDMILASAGGPGLDMMEVSLRPYWYEILSRAELELGRLDEAQRWADVALTVANELGIDGRIGEALRALSSIDLRRGDLRIAAERAREAEAAFTRADRPIDAARASILLADALASLGQREAAVAMLERASDELAQLDARRYQDQAVRLLRRLGRRPNTSRQAPRSRVGVTAPLTDRELEIAKLVGTGVTNRQVANALLLSEKTVETHVAHIFAKLDVRSRAALAAKLARDDAGVEQVTAGDRANHR